MTKILKPLATDVASERALISIIINNGKNAFIDVDGIVSSDDFTLQINRIIYAILKNMTDDSSSEAFDYDSIIMKAKAMGFGEFFSFRENNEYLELLCNSGTSKENLLAFAYQIRKYSVIRKLKSRYDNALNYIQGLTGDEPLSAIIQKSESMVMDFVTGNEEVDKLEPIFANIDNYIEELLNKPIIEGVGIPSGFPVYDDAIGGGFRSGTVNVIGARAKVGKSYLAANIALNLAKQGIPVLYLDTELTKDMQIPRMVSIESACPIYLLETRKFKENKDIRQRVVETANYVKTLPFWYENISGIDYVQAMTIARRWLIKNVGFDANGKANPCLIVYDYFKLVSAANIAKHTPEYMMLGFMLTDWHNFAVKYNIPIMGLVQLNRDGIEEEDTSVIAGSDRILWLCSSMSLLKNKNENDISLGCGWNYGNKKLVVLETRFGPGLDVLGDYINIHASLKPMVNKFEATGLIREGMRFSSIVGTPNANE